MFYRYEITHTANKKQTNKLQHILPEKANIRSQTNSPHIMEHEDRTPCLQKGTTCFSFQSQINQVHSLLLALSLFKWCLLFRVSDQHFYASFFSPCTLHSPPISYSLYYNNNLIWSRSYEAYHYVTIFSLLLLPTSYVQLFPGPLFSNNSLYCSLKVRSKFHIHKKEQTKREFNNN
jgi:hypothetical protein